MLQALPEGVGRLILSPTREEKLLMILRPSKGFPTRRGALLGFFL